MLSPEKSCQWTRALTSAGLGENVTIFAIQDSFSDNQSDDARVFTLNLCAEGEVQSDSGKIVPAARLRGYGSNHPEQMENPSAGNVLPLNRGIHRFRFNGQQWPKHPAGGVNFDLFIVADEPQQALIGNWAHAWHPGREVQEFQSANDRPFEERQHILRIRGKSGFRVVLAVWPKGAQPPPLRVAASEHGGIAVSNGEMGTEIASSGDLIKR
jgi:hypothetical protein